MSESTLPRFQFVRELASNETGRVFAAELLDSISSSGKSTSGISSSQRLVCVKEIAFDRLSPTEREVARLEADLLASLHHPSIVAFYGCGFLNNGDEDHASLSTSSIVKPPLQRSASSSSNANNSNNNRFYIVMEYCAGGDLSDQIERARMLQHALERDRLHAIKLAPSSSSSASSSSTSLAAAAAAVAGDLYEADGYIHEDKVLLIFAQIAVALAHLHRKNIIHRDLKAKNVFLCGSVTNSIQSSSASADLLLRAKLGDFGISKTLKDEKDLARTCVGTPFYLSPVSRSIARSLARSLAWLLG